MRIRTLLLAAILLAVLPSTALASYQLRYYEGIVNCSTSRTATGYYLGSMTLKNASDNYATIHYYQTVEKVSEHTVGGTLDFRAQVGSDALAKVNVAFGGAYQYRTTIRVGTSVGSDCTVSPWHTGTIKAYLYRANCSGQEKVRVETYPDPGDPEPPKVESIGEGVSIESVPVITYEYHSFTARYPAKNDTYHVYSETPIQ